MWVMRHIRAHFHKRRLVTTDKQDVISLIREYKNVFTWSYEDMHGLDLRWPCIVLILNQMLNWLSSNNNSFDPTLRRQSKPKFTNPSNVASFKRSNTQTRLLILCPFLKRTKRSESALTFVILTQPVLRMNFCCPSMMS